jgi:hypothetical protein
MTLIKCCRVAFLTCFVAVLVMPSELTGVAAQPCNPVIDGTYCATQMGRAQPSGPTSRGMQSIEGIAGDILIDQNQPATLGAITFQGDRSRCIGLLRRSNCS